MNRVDSGVETSGLISREISAALELFEKSGPRAITFRSIAEIAEVPTASIQRQFGTKDRLLDEVFRAFIARTDSAMEDILRLTSGAPAPLESLPSLLTALATHPAGKAHRMMTIEFLAAAVRSPQFRPLAKQWYNERLQCWRLLIGTPNEQLARFLVELQIALTLDSIGLPDTPILALANEELAAHALLDAKEPRNFWFGALLRRAVAEQNSAIQDNASAELHDFLNAGADIVLKEGSDAISFRRVAQQAQRTFASVSSIFRRKDILVSSICEHMVDTAMSAAPPPLTGPRDLPKICEIVCDLLTGGNDLHGDYYFLGHVEIRILAARNHRFAALARRMRMMNGLYPLRRDDPAYDPAGKDAFVVHSREIWSRGAALIQTAMQDENALRPALLERLLQSAHHFEAE